MLTNLYLASIHKVLAILVHTHKATCFVFNLHRFDQLIVDEEPRINNTLIVVCNAPLLVQGAPGSYHFKVEDSKLSIFGSDYNFQTSGRLRSLIPDAKLSLFLANHHLQTTNRPVTILDVSQNPLVCTFQGPSTFCNDLTV